MTALKKLRAKMYKLVLQMVLTKEEGGVLRVFTAPHLR